MNNKQIQALQSGHSLKDDRVPGLQVRAFQKSKCWYVYYRFQGQQRKPKIGEYPLLTLSNAREIAKSILADVARGRDYSRARMEARAAPTVKELAARYMQEHGAGKKDRRNDEAKWRNHVCPKIGTLKVNDVRRSDIERIHKAIGDRGHKGAANRTLAMLSKAFNLAIAWEWREGGNPCVGVRKYPESAREPYLSSEQLASLMRAIRWREKRYPKVTALVKCILLTGARLNELMTAKWEYLTPSTKSLNLPDSKTGRKRIMLSKESLDFLLAQPRINEYIFPGRHGVGHLTRPHKIWNEIREAAGLPWLRLHDLRHNYAAIALSAGYDLGQIGELLGHKSTQTTKRYASLKDETALAASDRIAQAMRRYYDQSV